jgi:S-adenosylmethionine hydrolase
VITNIEKHLFEAYRNGRNFELSARNKILTEIYHTYSDIINFKLDKSQRKGPGDLLALFNSAGFIELAIYKSDSQTVGSAATLLGLEYRDTITINFS